MVKAITAPATVSDDQFCIHSDFEEGAEHVYGMNHKSGDLPEILDLKLSEGMADLKYNNRVVYII